jgi:hypothetical protein
MMYLRSLFAATLAFSGLAAVNTAYAVPCPNGGDLNIIAAADSLSLTPVPATTFNFGEHVIASAQATGFAIATYLWTIGTPAIKDYNEDMGTKESPTPAAPWDFSTTALTSADLTQPTVGFYWTPLLSQQEPNNGPFTRNIRLMVTKVGGGSCTVTVPFNIERNQTNTDRQAEDFYTSNHRAATTTNPLFGHVIDEHIFWHQSVHGQTSFPEWTRFLPWHGALVRHYEQWRALFGYRKLEPWYPGTPLPTGPMFDVDPKLRLSPYVADDNRIPTYYTIAGGTTSDFGRNKLADYRTLFDLNYSFEGTYHSQIHCNVGSRDGNSFGTSGTGYGSMCKTSSPKDPIFWRWHMYVDLIYRNYCALKPGACTIPSPPDPPAEPWIADNNADVSGNGAEPSPSPWTGSIDIWNRYDAVTTDACISPVDSYGNKITTGGVVRRCGTNLDNKNPMAGVTNYIYGRLRNTRSGAQKVAYAEVAVYYALTSSQLRFPTDFTMIPESRQFIALDTAAGVVTSIGPIPWVPPAPPAPGDQYTLYARVLSVQATPPAEGASIDANVSNNNTVTRMNINVVPSGP